MRKICAQLNRHNKIESNPASEKHMTGPSGNDTEVAAVPNAHELRKLACEAVCSDRTALRLYRGLPVRQTSAVRLLAAIKRLGMTEPDHVVTR